MGIYSSIFSEEYITGIAILTIDGELWTLPRPNRQADLIRAIYRKTNHARLMIKEQGFVTNLRPFVDRWDAKAIASNANQFLPDARPGIFLKSRDIW